MIILHYFYVFLIQSIFSWSPSSVDRRISFRKRLRSQFFELPTSDERHLLLSTYRISSKDVFLFRPHSYFSTSFNHQGPFLSIHRAFLRSYLNLVDSTSRYPPDGPVLITILEFLATIASLGVHFYFAYQILRKRGSLYSSNHESSLSLPLEPSSPRVFVDTQQIKTL